MSQKHKARSKKEDKVSRTTTAKPAAKVEGPALPKDTDQKSKLDKVVDELEDILETNAEEMVKSYRQQGGE